MISPSAYVDPGAKIGANVTIHPFAYVDADTVIGDGCEIKPYASILAGTTLGRNVKVYQGAIIGAEPQDFRWKGESTACIIGDNTVIREQVIINRSISPAGATMVGSNCFVFATSHIGHDCQVADRCVLGNSVKLAGSVVVEEGSILSSGVILHENAHVGRYALLKGGTRVSTNVPPYVIMAHNPVSFYGINDTVLTKHAGLTPVEINTISRCYRLIYCSSRSLFNALQRIEEDIEDSEIRRHIVDFAREHDGALAGRKPDND